MSGDENIVHDDRFAALFAAVGGEGPPPDEQFLARLREVSAGEFAGVEEREARRTAGLGPHPNPLPAGEGTDAICSKPLERRRKMLFTTWRILTAAAAASIAVAVWLLGTGVEGQSATLGRAFDRLAEAKTLYLRVELGDKQSDAWVRQPGMLRWNESKGVYRIAKGDRVWAIDEQANRAASTKAECFRGQRKGLDPLGFLLVANVLGTVDDAAREALASAKPIRRAVLDGVDCDFYEVSLPSSEYRIDAVVDCHLGLVRSWEARRNDDGNFVTLAAVRVAGVDGPVDESLFVVGDTLSEDGRVGTVADAQGLCALLPLTGGRWTPLAAGALVMPGDFVRADLRGANAMSVRLAGGTRLTLGPGAAIQLMSPRQLHILSGEFKVEGDKQSLVELVSPHDLFSSGPRTPPAKGNGIYRVEQRGKLARLEKSPPWLAGFEGSEVNESMGSLIVQVDGRNTPLSVGYHKVSVDIRDQIARTVVEESFVNHTDARLEGVFHFPLPADASISGFGMWIGSELVEADIVEKQRAREIYETILRERRDPGLLEWAGGNIFKARVFPIEPHSEKRVKITYTQVLPRRGNAYRYSYALESEMLRQHPLRELAIGVRINSAVPLRSVASPTHPASVQKTAHSARVEFSAQEYTPTRDFETVIEVEGRQSELVLIPHRRGEDGYFMAMLAPPALESGPARDVLPEGESLDLLILADTSASMDRSARQAQAEFIAAVLGSLGPKDRVNLACCDVECDWAFDQSRNAEDKSIEAAREFLDKRVSLGWTDLDKAFQSALAKAGPKTQIIYVGDGVVTTREADAAAFGKRLRRMYECGAATNGVQNAKCKMQNANFRFQIVNCAITTGSQQGDNAAAKRGGTATCHAVSVGSSFEAAALKAIASCGGGSVRQISGERGPSAAARELLGEIARPAFKNLKIECRGFDAARVYPEELPNLPAGQQQIILGRYLPTDREQSGEVVVSGTLDGRPIRYATPVSFADAEQGNSFIPRLWARMHLDQLLEQGASQAIQDEIISLSEEYNILTPYTSLLVLESDADRERFKVKRRFAMRDGERFFAQGRDNANFDLVQEQMRRAGLWRVGMRRSALAELSRLGRDGSIFSTNTERYERTLSGGVLFSSGSASFDWRNVDRGSDKYGFTMGFPRSGVDYAAAAGQPISLGTTVWRGEKQRFLAESVNGEWGGVDRSSFGVGVDSDADVNREMFAGGRFSLRSSEGYDNEGLSDDKAAEGEVAMGRRTMSLSMMVSPRIRIQEEEEGKLGVAEQTLGYSFTPDEHLLFRQGLAQRIRRWDVSGGFGGMAEPNYAIGKPVWGHSASGDWLGGAFPMLPGTPATFKTPEPKHPWPAEAAAIAEGLLRTDSLKTLSGARFERQSEWFDARFGELTTRGSELALVSPKAWFTQSQRTNGQTSVNWCDGKERGIFATALGLGQVRPSQPGDLELRAVGPGLDGFMLTRLDRTSGDCRVEVRTQGEGRATLRITRESDPGAESLFDIDTARHVVLSVEYRRKDKAVSITKYGDFVELGGAWWPGRVENFDAKGRLTSRVTWKYAALDASAFDTEIKRQLAGREQVQFLHQPLPSLVDAKRALAAGKTTFEDRFVLMNHFATSQQWARVMEHLEAAESLAQGKPGVRWVRDAVLRASRRNEELRRRMLDEAGRLTKSNDEANIELVDYLLNGSRGILEANESLRLLDALRPVYERQPAFALAIKRWSEQRLGYLEQVGRGPEARKLLGQLTADYPHDTNLRTRLANTLAGVGEREAALKLLREAIDSKTEWAPHEDDSLRNAYCELLNSQGRWREMAVFVAEWVGRNPETTSAYERHLGALVRQDKIDEAGALAMQWLKQGHIAGELAPSVAARLDAAVNFMLGNWYGLNIDRVDERWQRPLGDAAIFFALHETRGHVAERITGDWRFSRTDQCVRVRKEAIATLLADDEKGTARFNALRPHEISRLVGWAMANNPAVEPAQWRTIADRVRHRWDEEKEPAARQRLAQPLLQILSGRMTPNDVLAFLRAQWEQAPREDRARCARSILDALLGQPWSREHEDEALALLDPLVEPPDDEPLDSGLRLAIQLAALHRITNHMDEMRYQDRMKSVEHREKLTRTELRKKEIDNRNAAHTALADRLRQEAAKREGPIVAWFMAEALYLDVLAGRNLDKAAEECWELLPSAANRPHPNPLPAGEGTVALDKALQIRVLTMLANLAARKNAPADAADRLLKHLDAAIAAADKDDLSWLGLKYQLLVALDRSKDLEQALRAATTKDEPIRRWQLVLGYLLAEQGKLAEAIPIFETVAAADELGPAEWRTLADWYMAVGRRDDYRRAMVSAYKTIEEWRLGQMLEQHLTPWRNHNTAMPSGLNGDVLLIFDALFAKSGAPQNYLGQLQQFYRETRDVRLLASLSDAMVGHTAGQVYPMLQSLSSLLGEIRDEATADSIVEQLAKTRQRAKSEVDRRALDLLEALVERRGAELINQPGPHVEKSLAALRRAFQRTWTPGEPRMMAELLASLGKISQPALAAEQVREIEALFADATKPSVERLTIAVRLANVRAVYGQSDEAVALLERELAEYRDATGGTLPTEANEALGTLIALIEQRGHFAKAEAILKAELGRPANAQQAEWLARRLDELYSNALRSDGEVSLGRGEALYRAAAARIEAGLHEGPPDHRVQLLGQLCTIYRVAKEKNISRVADDLRAFAMERFAAVAPAELGNRVQMVEPLADALHDVAGPRDGIAFLLDQIDGEPKWMHYVHQGGWNQYGWRLSEWRTETKGLGNLEPRLLRLVLDELRLDLQSRQHRNHIAIYRRDQSPRHFWTEKEPDFARAAEEVYVAKKDSGPTVSHIAWYLYHGLGRCDRAIEILSIAWRQGLLGEGEQRNLATFLQARERYGESIAVLLPMVERWPDNMEYRVWLMKAYARTNQRDALGQLLAQTDEHFHKGGRWQESNVAVLAASCLENQLHEQAVAYYREAIAMRRQATGGGGRNDGTLSGYYMNLALALTELKNTPEAVEAASAAIVCWDANANNRRDMLNRLRDVLRRSPNLDGYVVALDKTTAETRLENPIVRKAIGQTYLEQQKSDKAIAQLRIAVELQPNDAETHQALLSCYDQKGDREGAVRQVLESLQFSRRDVKLYEDLGRRYAELARPADAERANTSIVEMLPHESEGHAALAEIRQRQGRWGDAIAEWGAVARLRALEPTGLLRMAEAQIHERRWDDARATLRRLDSQSWPSRFGEVGQQTRQMWQRIEATAR